MKEAINFKTLSRKGGKQICLAIGGLYTVLGAFSFLIMRMQSTMLSIPEFAQDEFFSNIMITLHEIWATYMPFMILLGLGYLSFGFFFNKINRGKYLINLLLSILSVIWVITYIIGSVEYVEVLATSFDGSKYVAYASGGFGAIMVFALMCVPQYIIGKRIKTEKN